MKGMTYPSRKASHHGRDAKVKSDLESGLARAPEVLKETDASLVGQHEGTQRPMDKSRNVHKL